MIEKKEVQIGIGAIGLTAIVLLAVLLPSIDNSNHDAIGLDVSNDQSVTFVNLSGNANQTGGVNLTVTPCSYTVYTNTSSTNNNQYYFAKNCTTGIVQFSGRNASQVINQAINVTTNSQLIFIKRGVYILYSPIELQHGLTLIGESGGQNVTNGRQGTHFWIASGRNINAMEYTKNYLGYFITISQMYIDGNYQNNLSAGNGIYLNTNASDFEISDTYIDGFRQNCFLSDNSFNYRFFGSTFEHCQNDGMYIKSGTDDIIQGTKALTNVNRGYEFGTTSGGVAGLMFIGNYIAGNLNNNIITFNVQGATYTGNTFQESATNPPNYHLVMENNCSGSLVIGNSFIGAGHTKGAVDITHASCSSAQITDNTLTGTWSATPLIVDSGTNTIIRSNQGFKTENSGSATISASTSIVVTHGLAYTPSINDIYVTPQGDPNVCAGYWISTVTSTQFTINCHASTTLTFSWSIKRT